MTNNDNNQATEPVLARLSKRRLIIVAVLLLLSGAGAGGAYMYFMPKPAAKKVEKPKPPVFVKLEPFTVNLSDKEAQHMLQTEINLQVENEEAADTIREDMPQLRNGLLFLLSAKSAEDLSTLAGKQKLSDEVKSRANVVLGKAGHAIVSGVYFNSFIIQ